MTSSVTALSGGSMFLLEMSYALTSIQSVRYSCAIVQICATPVPPLGPWPNPLLEKDGTRRGVTTALPKGCLSRELRANIPTSQDPDKSNTAHMVATVPVRNYRL